MGSGHDINSNKEKYLMTQTAFELRTFVYQMGPLREREATKCGKIFAVYAIDKWLISGML